MSAGGVVSLLLSAALVGAVIYHAAGRRWPNAKKRRAGLAIGAASILLIAGFAGAWSLIVGYRSDEPLLPIAGYIDRLVDWLVTDYGDVLRERISNPVVYAIGFFERFRASGGREEQEQRQDRDFHFILEPLRERRIRCRRFPS